MFTLFRPYVLFHTTTDLGGIQSVFTHLTPEISERIQPALTEMNAELDQLRNLVSQMKMKEEDSQMRIEEEDSQIAIAPIPESN